MWPTIARSKLSEKGLSTRPSHFIADKNPLVSSESNHLPSSSMIHVTQTPELFSLKSQSQKSPERIPTSFEIPPPGSETQRMFPQVPLRIVSNNNRNLRILLPYRGKPLKISLISVYF